MLPDRGGPVEPPVRLPDVPWVPDYAWINTPPLKLGAWRGSVVLIDVWNIQCKNCLLSLPFVHEIEAEYGPRGLKLLGVHTPEFPEDGDVDRVHEEVKRLGVTSPVVMDNQYDFWRSLGNRYWPTYYLADKLGNIRYKKVGQLQAAWPEAREFRQWIEELLAE